MRKCEYLADKLVMGGQRLGYRNAKGEKRGEKRYEANLQNVEGLKEKLKECFEDGTWNEEKDWGETL